MSLLSSLFTGVTGMTAYGNAMSIIGNNIANVNTSGFKAGRPLFGDLLSASMGSSQIGRGVELTKIDTLFQPGSYSTTENITDMAIDGPGFFAVRSNNGTFFTRAGNFHFDADGFLVDPNRNILQGSPIVNGNVTGAVGDIRIDSLVGTPKPTAGILPGDGITIAANLDSRAASPAAFTTANPSGTSNFSTSITAYDSLGNGHLINIYFRKEAVNSWSYHVTTDGADVTALPGSVAGVPAPVAGTQAEIGRGTLAFTTAGLLDVISASAAPTSWTVGPPPVATWPAAVALAAGAPLTIPFSFSGGATAAQQIGFNFGDALTAGGAAVANATGLSGLTQYGATSAMSYQKQDGYAVGSLRSIAIDQDGILTGIYTNGQTIDLSQVFLADFRNPGDLTKAGKNLFSQSKDSGEPIIGPPGSAGKGKVVVMSIELSNVDLAAEFVNMITTQRAFTANTRIIGTADQMLTELVNLKR